MDDFVACPTDSDSYGRVQFFESLLNLGVTNDSGGYLDWICTVEVIALAQGLGHCRSCDLSVRVERIHIKQGSSSFIRHRVSHEVVVSQLV